MDQVPDQVETPESTEIPLSQVPPTVAVLPVASHNPKPRQGWLVVGIVGVLVMVLMVGVTIWTRPFTSPASPGEVMSEPKTSQGGELQLGDEGVELRLVSDQNQTKLQLRSTSRDQDRILDTLEGVVASGSAMTVVDDAVYVVVDRTQSRVLVWTDGRRQREVTTADRFNLLSQMDHGVVMVGTDKGAMVAAAGVVVFEVANTDLHNLPASPEWIPVGYDGQVSWWWVRQPTGVWGIVAVNQSANRVDLYNLLTLRLEESKAVFDPESMMVVYLDAANRLLGYNLESRESSVLSERAEGSSLNIENRSVVLDSGERYALPSADMP